MLVGGTGGEELCGVVRSSISGLTVITCRVSTLPSQLAGQAISEKCVSVSGDTKCHRAHKKV
jgi:hypothetical protein